jgi:Glycosyl transferases group 1
MKVLLFSNDLMPFGNLPTSGGGLRCWQLYQGLRSHGFEVIASMPAFTYLTEKHYAEIPEEQRGYLWNWADQDEIYKRTKPDAVLFASNWDHFNINVELSCPLIIDLHGSRLIETRMWNSPVDTEKKLSIFNKADCLLSAGKKQRMYFYGWLLQAGMVPEAEHFIKYIPISLDPILPKHSSEVSEKYPLFVSGGGWFPWQNQAKLIFATCEKVSSLNRGRVEIFGTPHETQTISEEEKIIRNVYQNVLEISKSNPRVNVNGYVSRTGLLDIYSRASVALEGMVYNLERELAFTTRTIEYLWCGLPVIYNNYSEISSHIQDYDAGWCINPESDIEISQVLEEIFESPDIVKRKSANAQKLVQDRFSWDQTIIPLVEFIKSPQKRSKIEPAYGRINPQNSFLSPRGMTANIALTNQPIWQNFIIPAECISKLELNIALENPNAREEISQLEVKIFKSSGQVKLTKLIPSNNLPLNGSLQIKFPFYNRPIGGEELRLSLKIIPMSANAKIQLRALISAGYPFIANKNNLPEGRDMSGETVKVSALAISFIPGQDYSHLVKTMLKRAYLMIRHRQWNRLYHAIKRRLQVIKLGLMESK